MAGSLPSPWRIQQGSGEERNPSSFIRNQARREGEVVGQPWSQAKGWPGIYNRMTAGGREVGGQGFRHVRDKVGFTGIGFPRESASLT